MKEQLKNSSLETMKYEDFIILSRSRLNDVAKKHDLTHLDKEVFIEAVDNTDTNSCRLNITIRKLMEKSGAKNINRHIKRLTEAGLLKKLNNNYYVNPYIAKKGKVMPTQELNLFNNVFDDESKSPKHEEEIDYSKGF